MNEDMAMKTPRHMTHMQRDGDASEVLTVSWNQAVRQSISFKKDESGDILDFLVDNKYQKQTMN